MAAIGETLKSAREKRGLTLDQARNQTHIHSTVLAALEEGRCDELLTYTYVKSFLRKYTGYLGLDTKEILDEYRKLHPESAAYAAPGTADAEKAAGSPRYLHILKTLAILLGTTILIFVLGNAAANYLRNRAAAPVPAPAILKTNNETNIVPARSSGKSPAAAPAQDDMMLFREPIPKSSPISLTMKVKQQVLIQFKKDGAILYKRFLSKGSTETLKADNMINVYIAKAEAVEISVNNKRLRIDMKGAIKDLEITRKGVRIK
jgi:transcriptional regulator with XRE-family HTH domain